MLKFRLVDSVEFEPWEEVYIDPAAVIAVVPKSFGLPNGEGVRDVLIAEIFFANKSFFLVADPDRKVAQQIAEAKGAFGRESGFKTHGERLDILEADMDGIEGEITRIKDRLDLE